ncbi:MAG TPA: hypothetical protein VF016_01580 [Nitrososphaera sp.]
MMPATECLHCDILLEGREQFMGHMIHGHEMSVGQAEAVWKAMYVTTEGWHRESLAAKRVLTATLADA